jgi:hypothetical protein
MTLKIKIEIKMIDKNLHRCRDLSCSPFGQMTRANQLCHPAAPRSFIFVSVSIQECLNLCITKMSPGANSQNNKSKASTSTKRNVNFNEDDTVAKNRSKGDILSTISIQTKHYLKNSKVYLPNL